MATKPLLFPEDYSASRFDPNQRNATDSSRIDGYSAIVQANDIAKADDLRFRDAHSGGSHIKTKEDAYKIIGARPQELPVEFAWLRVNGPGGAHSASASAEIDQYTVDQGFVVCTKDRFDALSKAYGYQFNSAAWRVAEDGTIMRGYDVALFYRSGEVAKMWEQHRLGENQKAEGMRMPNTITAKGQTADTFVEEEVTEDVLITH